MMGMTPLDAHTRGTRCRAARDHRASGCAPQGPKPGGRRLGISTAARHHADLSHINFGGHHEDHFVTTGAKWEAITAAAALC